MTKHSSFVASTGLCLALACSCFAAAPSPQGQMLGREGSVDFTRTKTNWAPAAVGQPLIVEDRLRTLKASRAMVQLAELGRFRVNEQTTLEVLPPTQQRARAIIDLKAGALYFFTRDKPGEFLIQTPRGIAASRGTEFLVTIDPAGRDVFTVFDGEVELANQFGQLILTNSEQGQILPGQAPQRTPAIQAVNLVQWWLYYPGILDPDELPLTAVEQAALNPSLASYRSGDLVSALQNYPPARVPQSDAERVYYGALLLAAGQVDQAEQQLAAAPSQTNFVNALREVIAAVTLRSIDTNRATLATEWLARSYYQQSRFDLRGARASARAATEKSPNFGFAWERLAEMEFSFGRTREASVALDKSLQLAPRNAQAWALKGFLAAAGNDLRAATNAFQEAIDIDPALGNGWLGRGLVRIRTGEREAGRRDLQTAAAMEPNRSVLRSYLGKAFENNGEITNAQKELRLAKQLDPADPTPWLYSALLLRQQLRFNEAVNNLEKSLELNENRAVYRSRLLLDEDRAVRSSSLATIYQNAGMNEVSFREAARAVAADYGNPSAHLFLAESFNALRDPTRFNLRVETAWFNELLLANILAPVGGGNLSQNISQQEYSRLFEGNRIGFSTFTEGRSDGQVRELASQFGTVGNTSYSLDLDYQYNDGVRPNNELNRMEWYTTVKQQLTPKDSVLALIKYQDYHSGDNFQYYDPDTAARKNFTLDETQHPLAVAAYHHEWSPGVHTLALGGRIENEQRFNDRSRPQIILATNGSGRVISNSSQPFDVDYRSEFEIFTSELNQIIQGERFNLVLGGRFQTGAFDTTDWLRIPSELRTNATLVNAFNKPPAADSTHDRFQRVSSYGYYTLRIFDAFYATAGMAYDRVTYPENHRRSPISDGSLTRERTSPKAALVWSPLSEVTFRGVYSRALGGVSFDESFRLEPVQLAGFNQSFRTIIPESVAGAVSAPTYEVIGGAMDVKLNTHTYLGLNGEILNSEVRRHRGVFVYNGDPPTPPVVPSSTLERLTYDERSIGAAINQLASDSWAFGLRYKFTQSELHTVFPQIPKAVNPAADSKERADLHEVTLSILFNHSSGTFARAETQWFHQKNFGYAPELDGDDFFQQNLFVGYRFRRQRGEISVGVLNLNDTDYHLNPLNLYAELPRERVYVARLKFNF